MQSQSRPTIPCTVCRVNVIAVSIGKVGDSVISLCYLLGYLGYILQCTIISSIHVGLQVDVIDVLPQAACLYVHCTHVHVRMYICRRMYVYIAI